MRVRCPKCGKIWNYKGNSKYYATCPDCHKNVKIREAKNVN